MISLNRRFFLTSAAIACSNLALDRYKASASAGRSRPKIKVGQIGTGHAHASGVFSSLRQVSDTYEIVGVVENNLKRKETLGGFYQGVPLIDEERLLTTPGLQAVVIESEVEELLPTAKRCVEAGMHIHLDKPASETFDDYKQLLIDVQKQKLHFQMGYIYRYHPAFQFCYQAVKDGWLGDVFEIHAVMSKKVGDNARQYLSRFTGGSMFEIGCHVIDAMVRILGKPLEITPFARTSHPDQDTLVDNQLAVFDYPEAIASIRSTLVEYEGFRRRQFTVCGEFGTFDLRPLGGLNFRLALEHPHEKFIEGYQDVTLPAGPGGFISAFRDMAAIIREEKETDYPIEHELAVHESILRASGYPTDT